MATGARVLHLLLLAVWFGASVLFLFLAPAVGGVVESQHLAGDVITKALSLIDLYGVLAGPAILVTLYLGWLPLAVPLKNRALGAVVMTGAVLISRYWATPEIVELKAAMGVRLEYMDPNNPLMQEYQSLHSISSVLMTVHVVACLFLLISVITSRPKRSFGIEL